MSNLQLDALQNLKEAKFNAELMIANSEGAIEYLKTQLLREIDEKNFCSTPSERFGCQENIERLRERITEEEDKLVNAIKLKNAIARAIALVTQ